LSPNTGALAPGAQPKARLGVGCGRRSLRPAVRVRGYHPRKICENTDANSCILVTTCCESSCFFENYGQEVGGPIHCWSPNLKVGGYQSAAVPTVVAPMSTPRQMIVSCIFSSRQSVGHCWREISTHHAPVD